MKSQYYKKSGTIVKQGFKQGIIVIALIMCCGLFQQCSFFKKKTLEATIKTSVTTLNAQCPLALDNETRLDKVTNPAAATLQYHYTLINIEKDSVEIDPILDAIKQHLIQEVKVNKDLKYLRENNVTFIYSYNDSKGNALFDVTITPDLYNQ